MRRCILRCTIRPRSRAAAYTKVKEVERKEIRTTETCRDYKNTGRNDESLLGSFCAHRRFHPIIIAINSQIALIRKPASETTNSVSPI